MNIRETRVLLQFLAAIDRRTLDEDTVGAWAVLLLLEDVDPRDGMAGLKQLLKDSPDLLVNPGHVIAAAKVQRKVRERAERAAQPRRDPFGNLAGTPESDEAYRRYREAHNERFNAPALPPPAKVVPSPYQEWEKRRREASTKADSPIITDLDRIETTEATRQRYLQALRSMMTDEEREEVDRGVPPPGHIRGMAGDPDRPVPAEPAAADQPEEVEEGV